MVNSLSKLLKADDWNDFDPHQGQDTRRSSLEGTDPFGYAAAPIRGLEVPSAPSPLSRFEGISIFDDKGEVKRLVESVVEQVDPGVSIERLRKMDFSFIFTLFKRGKARDVEFSRSEIEASWDWRNGKIDETIHEKLEDTIKGF